MNRKLSFITACTCLGRTFSLEAVNSTRGLEECGFIFILRPALFELYPHQEERQKALARYTEHSNIHPFMMPLFTGMLLSLEQRIANGLMSDQHLHAFKNTTATTFSALGDSLFSGTLMTFWALLTAILLLAGHTNVALLETLLAFILLQLFRIMSFFFGLKQGLLTLHWIKKLKPINWAYTLKFLNALLLACFLWQMAPRHTTPFPWDEYALSIAALVAAAWSMGRVRLPRIILLTGVLVIILLFERHGLGM